MSKTAKKKLVITLELSLLPDMFQLTTKTDLKKHLNMQQLGFLTRLQWALLSNKTLINLVSKLLEVVWERGYT